MRMTRKAAFGGLLLFANWPAFAQGSAPSQPTPPAQTSPDGARSYVPEDFARFAPRNAFEMLQQVPGFTIRQERQERGLGQASGNVLVNGQRASGKSNDVVTELGRIPARNVVRIEIADGATLDIPGLSGQVANIITRASPISGQYAWRPEFRAHNTDPIWRRFESSISGTRGPVEFTLGLENGGFAGGGNGPTWIHGPDGSLIEERLDQWTDQGDYPRISGRFKLDGPGTSVGNLNLAYGRFSGEVVETSRRSGPGQPDRHRRLTDGIANAFDFEIGADYEFALGPGRLKLIGLDRGGRSPMDVLVVTSHADHSPDTASRFTRVETQSERIGRAEYGWSMAGDWQVSIEGAFNALDAVSELFILDPEGEFRQVPLPGSTARVEEDRYQAMASYGRPLAANLTMQLSAGAEKSTLSQIGGEGVSREFYRTKGQLDLAWAASPSTDLNFKLERRVGQLNFIDFLASVSLGDDREKAENPDLVPQQSWEIQVEAVRRLGSLGTITLRPYLWLIENALDFIPVGDSGQTIGNAGRAHVYGLQTRATINFDTLGWRGGRLNANLIVQESGIRDPLTGISRRISGSTRHSFDVGLRHDIHGTAWAWGSQWTYRRNAWTFRPNELGRQWEGPVFANLFVEQKDLLGLTVRATAGNLLGARNYRDRTLYSGLRTGPIAFTEWRDRRIGPIFSFSLRGEI